MGTDALELMTSVVSRKVFDYRKRKFGKLRQQNPIHLILDEAHRYIRKDANYIMRENIFERIAREGQKYSLYLIISSQRPSLSYPRLFCRNVETILYTEFKMR